MRMFSCLRMFVFLGVVFLFVGGTAEGQVGSLQILSRDPTGAVRVGDAVEAVFLVEIDRVPAVEVKLKISHSGIGGVTVSNGGITNFLGQVTVRGTLLEIDAYISAMWEDRQLLAVADLPYGLQRLSLAQRVFEAYLNTFQYPMVQEFFPDVLRAFKSPEIQEVLNPVVINHFVRDPNYIRAFYPDVDNSIIELLATNIEFQTLFRDENFHAALQDPVEIDELVRLIFETQREPMTLAIVSGDWQGGASNTALADPFVVEVRDQYDKIFSGVDVVFHVTRGGGRLWATTARTNSLGRAQTTLTLGSDSGVYQVEARVSGTSLTQTFTAVAATVDCEIPPPLPSKATTLSIVWGYGQEGSPYTRLGSPFVVEVRDQYGDALSGVNVAFRATRGGGTVSPATALTNSLGQAQTYLTLGPNPGANWVDASVSGIEQSQTFTATAIAPTEPIGSEPKPTRLLIVSGYDQRGDLNTRLDDPFIVRVRDQDNSPLAGIGVIFRVTMGGGQLSDTTAITDNSGLAEATLTLGSVEGGNRVRASVFGISQELTFTAMAVPPAVPLPPSVYWIEGDTLYRRSDKGVKEMLPVTAPESGWTPTGGLAVDMEGEKIYWTEQMGNNKGRIQSANLNGTEVGPLVRSDLVDGVPYGIAVDSERGRVYWTTSGGRIQRINNDGSKFDPDFIVGLNSPKHIAFDDGVGRLYWTETGRIRSTNRDGRKKYLVEEGLGELGGIAIADGVMYWAEKTSNGQGRIRSVNDSGSGVKLHAVLESAPEGIAVDAEGGRLYWATSRGEIQCVNLSGGPIQTVVEGAGNPVHGIALGRSSSVPLSPAAPSASLVDSVESALLANYPNPFNPETWIPYQLSEPANVTVSIYSVNGALVRRLALGHQAAGTYRSRSRAAYWDGRNDFGERVASGLYFYTFTAGDFTATRKMLIMK